MFFSICSFILCRNVWFVNCVSISFDTARRPSNSMWVSLKINFFWDNSVPFFSSFLHQIAEIHTFVHFISILAWFCFNFHYLLDFIKKKMVDPRWQIRSHHLTLYDIITNKNGIVRVWVRLYIQGLKCGFIIPTNRPNKLLNSTLSVVNAKPHQALTN